MKKLNAMLLIFMMIFATQYVFADNESNETAVDTTTTVDGGDDNVTDITEKEAMILAQGEGAHMRVLQLEKKLKTHIEVATDIVKILESNNETQVDLDLLTDITSQLEAIVVELENIDYEQNAENLAQEFISYKDDAIKLVSDFKAELDSNLSDEEKAQLKERAEEVKAEKEKELWDIKNKIEELRMQYNAKRAEMQLDRFQIKNPELIEKIKTGEIDPRQIKNQIIDKVENIDPAKREAAIQSAKEIKAKLNIENRERLDMLKEHVQEMQDNQQMRIEQRLEENRDKIDMRLQEVQQRVQDKFQERNDKVRVDVNPQRTRGVIEGPNGVKSQIDRDGAQANVQVRGPNGEKVNVDVDARRLQELAKNNPELVRDLRENPDKAFDLVNENVDTSVEVEN